MMKPGVKSTELYVTVIGIVASCLVALIPELLKSIPPQSTWAVVLGSLAAVAAIVVKYTGGRTALKKLEIDKVGEVAKGLDPLPGNPTSPASLPPEASPR